MKLMASEAMLHKMHCNSPERCCHPRPGLMSLCSHLYVAWWWLQFEKADPAMQQLMISLYMNQKLLECKWTVPWYYTIQVVSYQLICDLHEDGPKPIYSIM